jgi:hypothetical protein
MLKKVRDALSSHSLAINKVRGSKELDNLRVQYLRRKRTVRAIVRSAETIQAERRAAAIRLGVDPSLGR